VSPHRQTLIDLARKHGWTRGAELGVDKGILFEKFLTDIKDLHLIGVDIFPIVHRKDRCHAIAAEYPDRATLLVMRTSEAAQLVDDASLDFVFIDADHSYESVKEDIAHWAPKVRKGGWIGGHDYNKNWPGVIRAVDEAYGSRVKTYQPGSIWGLFA
jgi:predicted O-methyltransferase YrrM